MAISGKPLCAAFAFLIALTLAACSNGPIGGSADAIKEADRAAQDYRLSHGDKIHIDVFNEANLSGDYTVAANGQITLPLAGPVTAAGLTISEFRQSVVKALERGYVQQPNVTISSIELRPYYILGQVTKPGRYSFEPHLTVLDAVATAQGFTYRADTSDIYIRHARETAEREYELESTLMVQPGDTIRVAERYF
jgi:polysaccharide export outer membrane protein